MAPKIISTEHYKIAWRRKMLKTCSMELHWYLFHEGDFFGQRSSRFVHYFSYRGLQFHDKCLAGDKNDFKVSLSFWMLARYICLTDRSALRLLLHLPSVLPCSHSAVLVSVEGLHFVRNSCDFSFRISDYRTLFTLCLSSSFSFLLPLRRLALSGAKEPKKYVLVSHK